MRVREIADRLKRGTPTYRLYSYLKLRTAARAAREKLECPSSEDLSARFDDAFLRLILLGLLWQVVWQRWGWPEPAAHPVLFYTWLVTTIVLVPVVLARCVEVPAAFLSDSLEKLEQDNSNQQASKAKRIQLAIGVYFELMLNYALLYSLLPGNNWTRAGSNIAAVDHPLGVLDSLYFSVVTMTTLGYGDVSPKAAAGQLLAMSEAVSSVVLLVLTIGFYAASAPSSSR